jgi:hypothetical protein
VLAFAFVFAFVVAFGPPPLVRPMSLGTHFFAFAALSATACSELMTKAVGGLRALRQLSSRKVARVHAPGASAFSVGSASADTEVGATQCRDPPSAASHVAPFAQHVDPQAIGSAGSLHAMHCS